MRLRRDLMCGVGAAVLSSGLGSSPAQAQTAPAAAAPTGGSAALGEVIVTARKRSERLLEVPAPVTALSAENLAQQGALNMRDYFAQVPGLSVNSRGSGRLSIVLRGITTGTGNNPTTAVTIDEVQIGSSTAFGIGDTLYPELDPSELQRIEVLRGPQGTLYGASSLGGLIKFVTKTPDPGAMSGSVYLTGTSVAHGGTGGNLHAAVNVPLFRDMVALSLSGFNRYDAGYVDDSFQGAKDVNWQRIRGGRAALLVKLGPKVNVNLSALFQDSNSGGSSTEDVTINRAPGTGDLEHARLVGTDGYKGRLRVYSGDVNADLGLASLTSITSYVQAEHNGPQDVGPTFGRFGPLFGLPFTPGARISNLNETNKFSQEVRLASQGEQTLEWLVGGYYTRETNTTEQTIAFADPTTGATLTQLPSLAHVLVTPKYEEVSGFGSLTYHFNEKFDVQVGGRYAHIKFDGDSTQSGPLVGDKTTASHVSQNVFTFLVNPRYKLSDTQMVYGRVTSGYRPGGSNAGVPGVSQSFDSDRTVNYEIGYKAQLLGRALTVDASLFDIEWNKIQLQAAAPNGLSYISNGGKARSRGAELATTYNPGHGLTVRGNLAYTDAEMRKALTSGIIAAAGDQLPFSAKWSGSLSADETFAITGDVNGFVGATFSYVGKRLAAFTTRPTDQRFVMPSYSTLDLRAGADFDRYTVTVFVRNVTDKIGVVSGTPRDSITRAGLYEAGVIAPRTFGVSLAASF